MADLPAKQAEQRAMARPREFDETVVVEAAMHRFWAQGYELTSVRDLATSMGITGASLYNAFGDKRSLYRRALDHYVEHSVRDRIRRLSELRPLPAIRAFFEEIVERSVLDPDCRGCLLVNAAQEMAPYDPEFREAVAAEMGHLREFFHRNVAAGQRNGEITTSQTPVVLAAVLLNTLLGLRVMARTQRERDVLEAPVKGVLGLLEAGTAPRTRLSKPSPRASKGRSR